MSFITKRERVFDEYALFDLPARNEGKLKAYASCTDARAWSHFCSDKSEHLVEIIKRNNDSCRPKYVPTEAIVDTLMVGKNAEIARLQRKIEEFEQMIAAYDDLELSCEQKCEIAKAHAAIKEANSKLDDMWLNLDLSGFTEGLIDSEAFETGKSRGDEPSQTQDEDDRDEETPKSNGDEPEMSFEREYSRKDTSNQAGMTCQCDATTIAVDPRIQEMQDTIITKDAKLNAMKNSMAVMENDVCEPYCIYAHIYTALVKIFEILCQNDKYKLYLELMTSGKDTRCIDIKGKILFKLKVLEKFSLALIAPCSQDFNKESSAQDCSCYRAEIVSRVETTYALTSAESQNPCIDNKRAQLVADIMENDEMKEILSKDSASLKHELEIDELGTDYNIDTENLKRLKNLQENYDDLMTCYETLKKEKDCLLTKFRKYEELEKEFESLKCQLREYNALWNEKEYYQRRSMDLDKLKEQYFILSDETSNLEVQVKAESEINNVKTKTIDDLRRENFLLEQRLNEASISFEKEKNSLQCKLKECECKAMCQDQQIKSLSVQVDRLLIEDPEKMILKGTDRATVALIDQINTQKEQVNNLKEVICCKEEENEQMQKRLQTNLTLINDFKMQIEDLTSAYQDELQRNIYLKQYNDGCMEELLQTNKILNNDIEEKSKALENLMNVIDQKSEEINKLMNDINEKNFENMELLKEIQIHKTSLSELDKEKINFNKSLHLAREESKELLEKVKDYDEIVQKQDILAISIQSQNKENKQLQSLYSKTEEENMKLKIELGSRNSSISIYMQEIQRLQETNQNAMKCLQDNNNKYMLSVENTTKESKILQDKFKDLSDELQKLKDEHKTLLSRKNELENELCNKKVALEDAQHSIQLRRQESEELLHGSENLKTDLVQLNKAYARIINENQILQNKLVENKNDFDNLSQSFDSLKLQNEQKYQKIEQLKHDLDKIKKDYDELVVEKTIIQNSFERKSADLNNLRDKLKIKIEENMSSQTKLAMLKKESDELIQRVKNNESLESEYDKLKSENEQMRADKINLERELDVQVNDLRRIERENYDISSQSQHLMAHSEELENALIHARTELLVKSSFSELSLADIIKEIEEMKREKNVQHKKMNILLEKLEYSDIEIMNLTENVKSRDRKIAMLENHINGLQDEIGKLQDTLNEVVDTGEQITERSSRLINESLMSMEAHHSRATHNMKMELAKLKGEETARDIKHKYISQIKHLQNEREIIVTEIKQLEMGSVGDSELTPDRCDVEDILASLARTRKYLDARSYKNTSLEQTLLSVQNSYQLVQTKTDEAKKIVEKEKQKIINEKEDAIRDKMAMEKQLIDLKKLLKHEKDIIKDLEAEILNQKLIFDKILDTRQCYISKLEEDMNNLQTLYQESLGKNTALEQKLKTTSEEKAFETKYLKGILEKTNREFEANKNEIELLKNELTDLKIKPSQSVGIQTIFSTSHINMESQTDALINYEDLENTGLKAMQNELQDKIGAKKTQIRDPISVQSNNIQPFNEVQVLTANVDSSFDHVRNSYLNFKLKQLSTGRLEHLSISCENNDSKMNSLCNTSEEKIYQNELKSNISSNMDPTAQNINVIDIYNKLSMDTNSSKVMDNEETELDHGLNQIESINKSNTFTGLGLINKSFTREIHNHNEFKNTDLFGSTSEVSTDKDLFVIYKDSDNLKNNQNKKKTWTANEQSEIVVESVTVAQNKKELKLNKKRRAEMKYNRTNKIESETLLNADDDYEEDDSVKHKLKIHLPRVELDSFSIDASDGEKKSLDSYTTDVYPTPKVYSLSDYKTNENNKFLNNQPRTPSTHSTLYETLQINDDKKKDTTHKKESTKTGNNKTDLDAIFRDTSQSNENESHHKLFRVGADLLLVENAMINTPESIASNDRKERKPKDFGLDYILDSHNNPDNEKTYEAAKALRKTRSDERFNPVKRPERSDSSPSRLSDLKKSSTDYKTISSKSYNKSQNRSSECKLDAVEEYENKIKSLTKTMENIEKDYKKKIEAIKMQYDGHIRSILNKHNQGVESIQSLHEETLKDIIKIHENEVENLRSMSIEAMRKADKLEKENRSLKTKIFDCSSTCLDEEPVKMSTPELKRRKRARVDPKLLTKTNVVACNVKPISKLHGLCTCSLDINISDTIRNIFEQVDVEQRKTAEYTYLKFIANKILNGDVEALDTQELSFLHLKVCRIWKNKLTKEESLQKRIDSLEAELMSKQKHAQLNIAELDFKVAEERRRLQEVQDAVCRNTPTVAPFDHPAYEYAPPVAPSTAEKDFLNWASLSEKDMCKFTGDWGAPRLANTEGIEPSACSCTPGLRLEFGEKQVTDLHPVPHVAGASLRPKRTRNETSRAVLAKLDAEERREKKIYNDEQPTRLRRTHDRLMRKK